MILLWTIIVATVWVLATLTLTNLITAESIIAGCNILRRTAVFSAIIGCFAAITYAVPALITMSKVLCLAIATSSFVLIRLLSHHEEKQRGERLVFLLPLIAILLLPFLMLTAYQHDPQYSAWRFDLQTAESHLAENAREGM